MKSFLSQIINYGLFFIIVFTINSCAHFRIKNLEKNKLSSNNFYEFLSKEYLDFAKYELYEMHDEIDANYFAYKASLSLNEKVFFPEKPKDWNIPEKYLEDANYMFDSITNLINKNLYNNFPKEFAKMMIGYDCWIEQVEENWQLKHINLCYKKFNQNFKLISNSQYADEESLRKTDSLENSEKKKNTEKNNASDTINITDETQVYETVVFFEFDKFTLSSDQVIELEKFIKTSMQNTNMKILIEGHTDTMGTDLYNLKLSNKRAAFIKDYLIKRNINNAIETIAHGETKLLVKTKNEKKEKQNRRAELYLK